MTVRAWAPVAFGLAMTPVAAAAQSTPSAGPAATAASAGLPSKAAPESDSDFEYELTLDVASDYVFRGVDQTNRHVAGGVDLSGSWKSAYVGVAAANIDYSPFGDRKTDGEIDGYVGYKDEAFGFTYDIGAIYYGYLNQPGHIDYVEGYVRGYREIGPLKLGASLYGSPDYGVDRYAEPGRPRKLGGGVYGEADAAWRLSRQWTVSGAIGHGSSDYDYLNWHVGVAYALTRVLSADLRYSDTDAHDLGRPYGGRLIVSLRAGFR